MKEVLMAIGLLLFIEGSLYALFPSKMRHIISVLTKMPLNQLRFTGFFLAFVGFLIIWYIKK
ncbi:MAG: ubiquitin-binding protein [Candidatus Pelagibacter sp.]|nr:ubiquitin-binding protein [Candidatus Pelagibacter sp.]|tara:strand:- start:59 stop:244 length:186 start_codon:yes stop_codon:yes gene_type:complete